MSSKLKFHQKRILTKNLQHGAKNVQQCAESVRHGAKNVRPIEVGTDVSNSLGTVGRDERRCLSYPMTQIACVLMTTRTGHLFQYSVFWNLWWQWGHVCSGISLQIEKNQGLLISSKDFGELLYWFSSTTVSKIYLLTGIWKVFLLFILFQIVLKQKLSSGEQIE